ncbi:hypothetical protein NCC78_01720 [Micromonospora phytophila]|uniref:hypothetical protein n=1 Tax=Micromonospora phytophila TaxID=709888 RepID=UPI002030B2BF|nr:hypothetical protein [Micromonospora phytophila]MCM0673444.1 hypothetical protein [Micromonospora phytophila]
MSGRDGSRPRLVLRAPSIDEDPSGSGTFRRTGGPEAEPATPRKSHSQKFLALLALLGLSAPVAPVALSPARASVLPTTARDGPTCPTPPAPGSTPQESPPTSAGPNGTASAGPIGYAGARDGHQVTRDGTGDSYGGDHHHEDKAAVPWRSSFTPLPRLSPNVLTSLAPMAFRVDCGQPKPSPNATPGVGAGKALPRISADPGQPAVAATPSKLIGSKVTMTRFRLEGIVELPTADGTVTALKFSMDQAVTEDFTLGTPGPSGRTTRFATDRLTVSGRVAFYATRFVGRLPGVKITVAPDLPLPDGIPIMLPSSVTFTDPAIDLAFVKSDTLTSGPVLTVD